MTTATLSTAYGHYSGPAPVSFRSKESSGQRTSDPLTSDLRTECLLNRNEQGISSTAVAGRPVTVTELSASIELLRPRLMKVARRFFRCESACEDAVQDAVLSAIQNLHRFRGDSKLVTWLHRILVNACLMKQRTMRRRRTESLESVTDLQDTRPASDEVDSQDTRQLLRAALTKLTPSHRTVVSLRCFEGFTTAEAAALLGIRQEALKTRLHRACEALRNVVAATCSEIC